MLGPYSIFLSSEKHMSLLFPCCPSRLLLHHVCGLLCAPGGYLCRLLAFLVLAESDQRGVLG